MLRFLTAGESHGRALVVIVEGLPAGSPASAGRTKGVTMARGEPGKERPQGQGEATTPRAAGATGSRMGRPFYQSLTPKP